MTEPTSTPTLDRPSEAKPGSGAHAPPTSGNRDGTRSPRPRRRWGRVLVIVTLATLLAVIAAAVIDAGGGTSDDASISPGSGGVAPDGGGSIKSPSGEADLSLGAEGSGTAGDSSGADGAAAPQPGATDTVTPSGPAIIKEGSVSLEVAPKRFDGASDRVVSLADAQGGFIESSQTSGAESDGEPRATYTVRVPTERFETTLAELRDLGTVTEETTSGRDVTGQVADVAARLSAAEAERGQLELLLGEAESIGDLLSVRDRISVVQSEIEQLSAQQDTLADRTGQATLSVSLATPGDPGIEPPEGSEPEEGFLAAWREAVDGFTGGLEWLLARSGTTLVALLVMGALGLAARSAWRVASRRLA